MTSISNLSLFKSPLLKCRGEGVVIMIIIMVSVFVVGARRDSRHSSSVKKQDSSTSPFWNDRGGGPSSFSFASVSGSHVNLYRSSHLRSSSVISDPDNSSISPSLSKNRSCPLEKDWLFEELGVWDPPWTPKPPQFNNNNNQHKAYLSHFQRDQSSSSYNPYAILMGDDTTTSITNDTGDDDDDDADLKEDSLAKLETTLSRVKLIPDEHHVSGFLNKGMVKRFLFINDKFGNPLSITITPCTSILHYVIKLWPVLETNSTSTLGGPHTLKTFRTQRPTTFTVPSATRGVYSVDMRPIASDSYVHLYASSTTLGPSRVFQDATTSSRGDDTFIQHMFTHVEMELVQKDKKNKGGNDDLNLPQFVDQVNTNLATPSQPSSSNRPRIWAQRLRGNRLHVRWDTSSLNPHLMQYCLVVNTRRDYTSLCSAAGERYGVLPPDLMHVTYYDDVKDNNHNIFQSDQPHSHRHHNHNHRHHNNHKRKARTVQNPLSSQPDQDLMIGCTNKRTNYILNNLVQGTLYYFNVFVRDTSTNVSFPYVRTTLKYHSPKNIQNSLRDNKPTKIKLKLPRESEDTSKLAQIEVTTVKFNLNKPCNELSLYVMPCGGGSVTFQLFHGENRSVYTSSPTDSLDLVKVAMPQKGKYFLKISPSSNIGQDSNNLAKMVEVFVAKKNRRLPLPRLPAITKLSEDESLRTCDAVTLQWWPSPDPRDNEYCIFLKEESRPRRHFTFKKPNQCDVDRSLRSDPYVTHSLCVQKTLTPETMLLSQRITGLHPGKIYVVQLILRRHNGKSLSYDLTVVQTLKMCSE